MSEDLKNNLITIGFVLLIGSVISLAFISLYGDYKQRQQF